MVIETDVKIIIERLSVCGVDKEKVGWNQTNQQIK